MICLLLFVISTTFLWFLKLGRNICYLTVVLERLKKSNLTAKPRKCYFGFKEIEYLGYRIGNNKVIAHHDRISDFFLNMTPPVTKKGFHSFLGSVNFYCRLIPNMADKTVKLTIYLKKGIGEPFKFSSYALDEFTSLKKCFVQTLMLEYQI